MRSRELRVEEATADSVAAFGHLVGAAAGKAKGVATKFYGDTVELWHVPDFSSDEDTCLSVARIQPRESRVIWMERHFKHTQTFLPLGSSSFIVVMAPPNEAAVPDLEQARALRIPSGFGLKMHIGTWHEFPFVESGALDLVVILRNETNRDLEVIEGGEAVGGDLEKRNIERRLGVSLRLAG